MVADPASRLATIAAALRAGGPLDAADVAFLEAFAAAQRQPRCLPERDRVLSEAAAVFFGKLSTKAQAERLAAALANYAAAADWRRDSAAERCPHPRGSLKSLLWIALRAADGRVPSVRQLRKKLALQASKGQQPVLSASGNQETANARTRRAAANRS
jgi:hypothetical protein